ncbi:uncharacterized protein QC763_204856 [Podospora pseudopauciseta]|uniref:HNH nuclease domain-containing protein n=1 Tax=Podospora pseudopauciseta TaxID=2093780 RepID=A0ABR0HPF8_9PEZI|nr:hypothetical protein QC763_204856 [Podospora pseudopauciseta]
MSDSCGDDPLPKPPMELEVKCRKALERYAAIAKMDGTRYFPSDIHRQSANIRTFNTHVRDRRTRAALAPDFDQDIDKHIATMAERSRPKKGRQYLRRNTFLEMTTCIMTATWWALRRYFDLSDRNFHPDILHGPENVISLTIEFVKEYRQFRIALEPEEGNGNIYTCRIMHPETRSMSVDHFAPQDQPITLTHHDNITMPSRDLLRIHHTLGKIFHAKPHLNWNVMIEEEGC